MPREMTPTRLGSRLALITLVIAAIILGAALPLQAQETTPPTEPAPPAEPAEPGDVDADPQEDADADRDDSDGDEADEEPAYPQGYPTPEAAVRAFEEAGQTVPLDVPRLIAILIPEERLAAQRFYNANAEKMEEVKGVKIANVTYNDAKTEATLTIEFTGDGEIGRLPAQEVRAVQNEHGWLLSLQELIDTYVQVSLSYSMISIVYNIFDLEGIEDGARLDEFADMLGMDEELFASEYPDVEMKDFTIEIIDRDAFEFRIIFEDADMDDNDRTPLGRWAMDIDGNLTKLEPASADEAGDGDSDSSDDASPDDTNPNDTGNGE